MITNHKELRSGNWVLCNEEPLELTPKYIYDVSMNYNPLIVEPIPLSPEILERCGFSRTINNKDSGYSQYGLNINGLDLMFSVECNGQPEFYLCMVGVDLLYLHQLQNLYWCLVGEELTYSARK